MLSHELYTKLKQIDSDSENCSVLKILFSYVLGKDYALTTWDELDVEDEEKITSLYQEYIDGKPVQYITHEGYFLEKKFYVDERVLIPRFATEDVVLKAVEEVDASVASIADICTGSGVIALTLKNMFPHIRVIATDISKDALDVCEINKNNLGIDIELYQGDLSKGERMDLVERVLAMQETLPIDQLETAQGSKGAGFLTFINSIS